MFYLTTHSTHFIYGYMTSNIWLRTILIVRKETRCRHIGYSYRLTARVLLYAPSHRQDNTYHGLCNTSHGALAGTRISSIGPPHEGSIRRPIAPWANALPLSYVPLPSNTNVATTSSSVPNRQSAPSAPLISPNHYNKNLSLTCRGGRRSADDELSVVRVCQRRGRVHSTHPPPTKQQQQQKPTKQTKTNKQQQQQHNTKQQT